MSESNDSMNKNALIKQKKIEGIQNALDYLHKMGVKNLMNKKLISETTKQLYPNNGDYQVSQVTLSNDFYKEQVPKMVKALINSNNPNSFQDLNIARQVKDKNYQKKLKKLQRFSKELANKIKSGELATEKEIPSKSFLTKKIKNQFGFTVNLSMKQYNMLYPDFVNELMGEGNNQWEAVNKTDFVQISKYKKVVREKQVAETEFGNLLNQKFSNYYLADERDLFSKGDGFEALHQHEIDIKSLFNFMDNDLKKVYQSQESVNAFKLVRLLIENCSMK